MSLSFLTAGVQGKQARLQKVKLLLIPNVTLVGLVHVSAVRHTLIEHRRPKSIRHLDPTREQMWALAWVSSLSGLRPMISVIRASQWINPTRSGFRKSSQILPEHGYPRW